MEISDWISIFMWIGGGIFVISSAAFGWAWAIQRQVDGLKGDLSQNTKEDSNNYKSLNELVLQVKNSVDTMQVEISKIRKWQDAEDVRKQLMKELEEKNKGA